MTFSFPPRKAVVPVDSGAASARALEWARVANVVEKAAGTPPCSFIDDDMKGKCETEEVRLHGSAAATILAEVQEHNPDLVVMGAERKSGALGGLFTSTTEIVTQRAESPLLVVPTA